MDPVTCIERVLSKLLNFCNFIYQRLLSRVTLLKVKYLILSSVTECVGLFHHKWQGRYFL